MPAPSKSLATPRGPRALLDTGRAWSERGDPPPWAAGLLSRLQEVVLPLPPQDF